MSILKPGMCCLIINHSRPANIGREVVLHSEFKCGDRSPFKGNVIKTSYPFGWIVCADNLISSLLFESGFSQEVLTPYAFCKPEWLMPIEGGDFAEQFEQEEITV